MASEFTPATLFAHFLLRCGLLARSSSRKIGRETEAQAAAQMLGR